MEITEIQEFLPLQGDVLVTLVGGDGKVKWQKEGKNLIVNTGKNFSASALVAGVVPLDHMAIGVGTTPAALTDTALQTETGRVAFSSVTTVGNVTTMTGTFGPGVGTGAVSEAGLFNNVIAGIMYSHIVFGVVNKAASDSLIIAWAITTG